MHECEYNTNFISIRKKQKQKLRKMYCYFSMLTTLRLVVKTAATVCRGFNVVRQMIIQWHSFNLNPAK